MLLRTGVEALTLWGWDPTDPDATGWYMTLKRLVDPFGATPFVRQAFAAFDVQEVETTWTLSSAAIGRGKKVTELIFRGCHHTRKHELLGVIEAARTDSEPVPAAWNPQFSALICDHGGGRLRHGLNVRLRPIADIQACGPYCANPRFGLRDLSRLSMFKGQFREEAIGNGF